MTTSPTNAKWLARILANPADNLVRLVYADWLEENDGNECPDCVGASAGRVLVPFARCRWCRDGRLVGAAERAEFIRLQLAPQIDDAGYKREAELFARHGTDWFLAELSGVGVGATCDPSRPWHVGLGDCTAFWPYLIVCRGWPEEVVGPLATLIGGGCDCLNPTELPGGLRFDPLTPSRACPSCHGTGRTPGLLPRLVREQPIKFVRVTDRDSACRWANVIGWFVEMSLSTFDSARRRDELPPTIFDLLENCSNRDFRWYRRYPTREAADNALSESLLLWAKRQTP